MGERESRELAAPWEMLGSYPDLMTVADVADALGVNAMTVRRRIGDGRIPAAKLGRRWYVPKSKLLEALGA